MATDIMLPKSPRKGKLVNLRVQLLDDSSHIFLVQAKAMGIVLWEDVVKYLELVEADYFDLEYNDEHGLQCWLDREKPILKQIPNTDTVFRFCVKFYTPDPGLLEEEYTRYLFALQVKRDLRTEELPCSNNTLALLASYIVQSEIGDFLEDEYIDSSYLSSCKILPHPSLEVEQKIMEYHKQHIGQGPSEADINLLDTARKIEQYGIRNFPAKDHEGVHLSLAVAHMGIVVFQNFTRINTFSWAKIRKLSFKRKKFLIKLHPENYGYYKDIVEFFFDSRNECKGFWKKCIEHHAFFRCHTVKKLPRNKTRVVSRGSSYRYSGKTQKQLMEYVRENYFKKRPFERSVSGRISRSTSATPKSHQKTTTLNSSDFHVSQNSTASSGSQILADTTQESNHVLPSSRVETAEVHSESSLSGSRSLGSPKLDSARSHSQPAITLEQDGNRNDHQAPGSSPHNTDNKVESSDHVHGKIAKSDLNGSLNNGDVRDSSSFLMDRKYSEPILSQNESIEDNAIIRSNKVENIPEHIRETPEPTSPNKHSLTRSQSVNQENQYHYDSTLPLPPPPPPPEDGINGAVPLSPPQQVKSVLVGDIETVASSNVSTLRSLDGEEETTKKKRVSKRRAPTDKSYCITKELLMTERTFKKDLEVVTQAFKNALLSTTIPECLSHLLFSSLGSIYDFHCTFLKNIEQRIVSWEGKSNAHVVADSQRIGDVLLGLNKILPTYKNYLDRLEEMLSELELTLKRNREFEQLYKEFEAEKACYLPLNTFLLKPGQRLLHYKLILERLIKHYNQDHPDHDNCQVALNNILEVINQFRDKMQKVDNLQKLIELQRDLVGIDSLVHPDRDFIREGCLQKFSRKGYQQRMFFLFSDMLIYTSRTATSLLQFKVHGQLPLRGMMVEESDISKVAVANSFTIYGGNKCILVAASSEEEKDKWIEDLNYSIRVAKKQNDEKMKYGSIRSNTSSTENVCTTGSSDTDKLGTSPPSPEKQIQHRGNTTMHVCWHRNTSVSLRDHDKAVKNQLSGYLLRKFKTSNGWQKLWVVFTNFCLFFYKTYQDDFPLASLPLLGYAVNIPTEEDKITKDHVFKLQFKNHVYFFRAESEYTFERWVEVIKSATSSARRFRLFSRLESDQQAERSS